MRSGCNMATKYECDDWCANSSDTAIAVHPAEIAISANQRARSFRDLVLPVIAHNTISGAISPAISYQCHALRNQ